MVKLTPTSPVSGQLPLAIGATGLDVVEPEAITSISASPQNLEKAGKSMLEICGLAFPKPNRSVRKNGTRAVWFAPGQCLFLGPPPNSVAGATLSAQSDGWCILRLDGADARAVLARLMPIDLRPGTFKRDHSARTLLGHMAVSVTRTSENAFDIMVFRSMTQTAIDEIERAMRSVAAQTR